MQRRRMVAGALLSISLALGIGVTATPDADAVVSALRNSPKSDRGIWVSYGFNGHGDDDYIPPGGWSELAFVGSVRVPARCELWAGTSLLKKKSSKMRYWNAYAYRPLMSVRLNC
jgi:hypothetical protein